MISLLALLVIPYVQAADGGTVRGTVTDDMDMSIPRVSIILSGPNISGELVVETDDEGNFRFVSVPVGKHQMSVLKTGFSPVKRSVTVRLDEAAFVPIVLNVGTEEVIIEETLPVIDTTRSSVSTQLSRETLDKLPVGRSYQDVVNILPGVSGRVDTSSGGPGDGNPSVRGEGQYGNNYLLDGISTRDPATKTFGSNVNYDAIEDVQVYTDGAPAEFGQATGMLVNVVTKDGGDEHHGSAGYFFNTGAPGEPTYLILDTATGKEVPTPKRDFKSHSLSLTAGGPIVKEKLWYFTSVDLGTSNEVYEGMDPNAPYLANDLGGFAKATWFVNPDFKLRYQFSGQVSSIENSINSSIYLPETQELYQSDDIGNQVQAVWRPGMLSELDLKVLSSLSHINVYPMSLDGSAAQVYDSVQGVYRGNAAAFDFNTRTRTGFTLSLTQLANKAAGNHRIKGGIEAWSLSEVRELDYTGPRDGLYGTSDANFPCTDAADYYDCAQRQEFEYVGPLPHSAMVLAAYLQDDWQPWDFLTINAGARLDYEQLYTSEGIAILEQFMPAPRLGIAWDATGDSKTLVSVNAGRYYDVNGAAFAEWGDSRSSAGYSYYDGYTSQTNPIFTQGANPLVFCTPESIAQQAPKLQEAAGEYCNGSLRPYHLDKLVLGVERELFPLFALGVRGILSQTSDIPEDINFDDQNWLITNPANKTRDYRALEVTAEKKLDDHWLLLASYTLSESLGTAPGQFESASGSDSGSNGNEVGVYGDDITDAETRAQLFELGYGDYVEGYSGLGSGSNQAGYYGYLPYHALHSVKINGGYSFQVGKFETDLGLVYEYDSGRAWQKRSYVYNYQDYSGLAEGRGTRFMPPIHYLDFHVAESFKIDEHRSAEIAIDIFNILDLSEAVTYYENDNRSFGKVMYRQAPRSIRASLKLTY